MERITTIGNNQDHVHIPDDLIFKILLKLPVKSLAKFNCVSKHWLSIIRNKFFIESYMSRSSTRPCFLFRFSSSANAGLKLLFNSLPYDNPSSSEYDRTKVVLPHPYYNYVSPSIRGLICIRYHSNIMICNPSTSQLVPLPDVRTRSTYISSFFGYDPINDEYKVMCMTLLPQRSGPYTSDEHQIFTVGVDSPWRKIKCNVKHRPATDGVCKNGVLYYGAWSKSNNSPENFIIVGFDMRLEEFRSVTLPNNVHVRRDKGIELFNLEGKLGLMNPLAEDNGVLWVLEDVKKGKWRKVFVIYGLSKNFWCIGTIRDGELIFLPKAYNIDKPFYVYSYDMKTGKGTEVAFGRLTERDITVDLDHVHNPLFL